MSVSGRAANQRGLELAAGCFWSWGRFVAMPQCIRGLCTCTPSNFSASHVRSVCFWPWERRESHIPSLPGSLTRHGPGVRCTCVFCTSATPDSPSCNPAGPRGDVTDSAGNVPYIPCPVLRLSCTSPVFLEISFRSIFYPLLQTRVPPSQRSTLCFRLFLHSNGLRQHLWNVLAAHLLSLMALSIRARPTSSFALPLFALRMMFFSGSIGCSSSRLASTASKSSSMLLGELTPASPFSSASLGAGFRAAPLCTCVRLLLCFPLPLPALPRLLQTPQRSRSSSSTCVFQPNFGCLGLPLVKQLIAGSSGRARASFSFWGSFPRSSAPRPWARLFR